jgi:bifunctional UDP-N-acetylglucosamine pyrophosphorylase/glucosamine-1-phosphate N-acetyltransferase
VGLCPGKPSRGERVKVACVVLAGGLGKRMKSSLPKVLHTIDGSTTMLRHVLLTVSKLRPRNTVVVVGKFSEEIKDSLIRTEGLIFAMQKEPSGTGNAVLRASSQLRGFEGTVLIMNGDTPLITPETLKKFLSLHRRRKNIVSVLSFRAANPSSYGRIVRDEKGEAVSIVENKEASAREKKIKEVNSGVYAFEHNALSLVKKIRLNPAKGEYFLTDIIQIAREKGLKTDAMCMGTEEEFAGINTPVELQNARVIMQARLVKWWADRGVSFLDSRSVFLSPDVRIGKDTVIYPHVYIQGNTTIGKGCAIYPNVRIVDSSIRDYTIVKDFTLIERSTVKSRAVIGPFAHIRPDSVIGERAKIGNFVEVKKSVVGPSSKASHLSYIGDARIGTDVNIGAGTITCNYDGYQKHVTTLADGVFIGSDSQLIAPVKVGKGAVVGAGSTITRDVPPDALALSRVSQVNIEGWAKKRRAATRGKKKRKGERKGRH